MQPKEFLSKSFGCKRYIYNWALNLRIEAWKKESKYISYGELDKMKNGLKEELVWLKEVNSQLLQSALRDQEDAYRNFFRDPKRYGFPRFKSRKGFQKFANPQNCSVDFRKGTLSIPKAKDIPAVLHRSFKGTVKTVSVSMIPSGRYYASVLVDTSIQELPASPVQGDTALGIDLGIKSIAVCSDGRTFDNPKNLQRSLDRLKLLQKRLSRKQKGSANRNKARSV